MLSSTLHLTLCLRAALGVFAYSALKSHIQFICMFPFWFGGAFPLADRRASGLFFRTCTWGHQLYWKVSVSFSHTSSHRGIRYLSEVGADNVLPLPPPPFPSSLQVQSSPLPPFFFFYDGDTWADDFSITGFRISCAVLRGTLSPCSSVPMKCPLQLEMPQIKGSSLKRWLR